MKRRYKLLIIILIGSIMAILIHNNRKNDKVTLVAMGDSLSVAMTPYGVVGNSFTDYVKEYLESKSKLKTYNYDYSIDHLLINDLIDDIKNNNTRGYTSIQQIIAKADIITIAIGTDELADISFRREISKDDINILIEKYNTLLNIIRKFNDSKIIVIGLYPVNNISKNTIIDINKNIKIICGKYNAGYIDIFPYTLSSNNYFKNDSYYLNYRIHKIISEVIIKSID